MKTKAVHEKEIDKAEEPVFDKKCLKGIGNPVVPMDAILLKCLLVDDAIVLLGIGRLHQVFVLTGLIIVFHYLDFFLLRWIFFANG